MNTGQSKSVRSERPWQVRLLGRQRAGEAIRARLQGTTRRCKHGGALEPWRILSKLTHQAHPIELVCVVFVAIRVIYLILISFPPGPACLGPRAALGAARARLAKDTVIS